MNKHVERGTAMNNNTVETITTLISEADIQRRVGDLALQISEDFKGKTITFVCVLKGGVIFMVELAKKIPQNVEFDFVEISSYGDETVSSGIVKVSKDLSHPITGKHVLLIEDIIDTGKTLSHLVKHLRAQQPASLKICTLLDKPSRRVNFDCNPDYVGFKIPDDFAVGFGLDYAQKYRNLPYIGVVSFSDK